MTRVAPGQAADVVITNSPPTPLAKWLKDAGCFTIPVTSQPSKQHQNHFGIGWYAAHSFLISIEGGAESNQPPKAQVLFLLSDYAQVRRESAHTGYSPSIIAEVSYKPGE